jgi:hypothetical protein
MPVIVAVVLGPLIAGLAVCLLAVVNSLFDPTLRLPLADWFTMFGFYIFAAYISGGAIALLAGILVSLWMISRPPSLIVAVAAAVLATAVWFGLGATGILGPVEYTSSRANAPVIFPLAIVAAIGCWLLMRRFAPRPG